MDYEKAYKAVLETARMWIKDGCSVGEQICLECVFPELRESEDERIRKRLIEYFEGFRMGNVEVRWEGLIVQEVLAWLEKQKELFKSGRGLYYYDGEKTVYTGCPAMEENPYDFAMSQQEKQKEQDKCPEYCVRSHCIGCSIYEKQKEQKPSCGNVNVESEFDKGWRAGHKAGLKDAEQQKPAEWSEEDRLHYVNVLEALEYVKGCKSDYDKIEAVKSDIAWFKSLRSRPKSSDNWKPSEGQMKALIDCTIGNEYDIHALVRLWAELKKL